MLHSLTSIYYIISCGCLTALGYMPNFATCMQCGKDVRERRRPPFRTKEGASSAPGAPVGPPQEIPRGPSFQARRSCRSEGSDSAYGRHARELMEAFMHYHLNVEFKSYRLLKSVIG